MLLLAGGCVIGVLAGAAVAASRSTQGGATVQKTYAKEVKPLLTRYCYGCHDDEHHRSGLSLQRFTDASLVVKEPEVWEEVLRKVRSGEMPPEDRAQPSERDRARVADWVERALFPVDCEDPDPGRVTIRRLNRAEYDNTIRDLVGVDFRPAADFPVDDSGYGFDNIGDVLTLSPLLLEKYLSAAERILSRALVVPEEPKPSQVIPETHWRIFVAQPGPGSTNECAREIISRFATRAYRRPVTADELSRLSRLGESARRDGASFELSIKVALEAVLVSPQFLFRGELQPSPDNPREVKAVDEYALASRLSYFLWSSMPDEELFALASKRQLRKRLEPQVRRMLQDGKARALVSDFGGQWLQTRMLAQSAPDPMVYPEFDDALRSAMATETEMLFANIIDRDASVLEFLTADYSFLNERLARHYGIKGVTGPDFRRVSLKGTARAGVLTQGSVLTLTSNPTRTSPVKRGKWVLENLLGQAPPPPPPGVPPLKEAQADAATASLRSRMEQHRSDPMCASCHAMMDPIGFSLEHFDGVGAWREKDGSFPIDASGKLNTGERFSGASELRDILARSRRDQFAKCISEKMLTYALGRGLERCDRCAVEAIGRELAKKDYRFSALVMGVVKSVPFQMRRGEGG